jgi:hypothetical protein
MERKKWDTGSERTSLTERKIELLESIDFIWAQNHKGEIGWERRFQEIRKFKRKHGHCNVPTKSAENRALGRWVSTQRTMYKNYMKGFVGKSLTREEQERRIFLLLKEGFLFSMIPNGQTPSGSGMGESNEEGIDSVGAEAASPSCPPADTSSESAPQAEGTTASGIDTATTDTTIAVAGPTSPTVASDSSPTTPADSKKGATDRCGDIQESKKNNAILDFNQNTDKSKVTIDYSENEKATIATTPSSPSLTKESIPKHEATPPASRAPSIAQVSVTTTPTTTPSVSTTASPDRSPGKAISSGDEPDCVDAAKDGAGRDNAKPASESVNDGGVVSSDAIPVVPSLKADHVSKSMDRPQAGASFHEAVVTKEENSSTEAASGVQVTTPSPMSKSLTPEENASKALKDAEETTLGTSKILSSTKEATSAASSVLLPTNEEGRNTAETFPSKEKSSSVKAEPKKEKTPLPLPLPPPPPAAAAEPVLITSDGLRIIVTMMDSEDVASPERSPSAGNDGTEAHSAMSPSPSRRSVRARKPSARQLEAEKNPVRESILGR